MTKPPSPRRARAVPALVLLCALPAWGAAQIAPQASPPQPPYWLAPPLSGPFAALVPDTLAKSLTCRATDPLPEDSLATERTPRMVCSGILWSSVASQPRTAYAILKADGEDVGLLLSWNVSPGMG